MKVLVLGGTTEAAALARLLHEAPTVEATLSLAGRTRAPAACPLATRIGGFGGPSELAEWLRAHAIAAVVDATHPFAAGMSHNAALACAQTGTPLARLVRAPWLPGEDGDNDWHCVADLAAAAATAARIGQRIFLTVGGHSLGPFERFPERFWLVRSIDPPQPPPAFGDWALVQQRGPFDVTAERALLRAYRIDTLVTKNSGGEATRAKLDAARDLGLPVVMVERPALPAAGAELHAPAAVLAWLDHGARLQRPDTREPEAHEPG